MSEQEKHIDINLLTRFLTGESDPGEKTAVNDWIAQSEKNRSEFEDLKKVWDTLGTTSSDQQIDITTEWDYLQSKLSKNAMEGKGFSLASLLRIAAVVVLIFSLAFFGVRYLSQKTISTQRAETTEIALPDGSKVTLNAGSRLQYKNNFGKDNRVLSLQGEAFFEVKSDAEKSFIIKLQDAEVQVLGTSFNVKAYKGMDKVEVTVAEGKVSVYDKKEPRKKLTVVSGERAEYSKLLKVVKKKDNPDQNFDAWKTRHIIFENDSLSQIISTISSVYHKTIELRNPELKDCTLTTIFENEDLETVFQVLESTLDISIEEKADKIIISGSGC